VKYDFLQVVAVFGPCNSLHQSSATSEVQVFNEGCRKNISRECSSKDELSHHWPFAVGGVNRLVASAMVSRGKIDTVNALGCL
jgi:hypothetical protein